MLFNSNLSRRPSLGQVIDLDLTLCTGFDSEHAALFPCHNFSQRPTTDRKIEQSDWRCFGQQQILANSIEKFISHETRLLQSINTFSTLELSQYRKSGSTFS